MDQNRPEGMLTKQLQQKQWVNIGISATVDASNSGGREQWRGWKAGFRGCVESLPCFLLKFSVELSDPQTKITYFFKK